MAVHVLRYLALSAALVAVRLSTVTSDVGYPAIPFLFVEGTHYDIGRQIVGRSSQLLVVVSREPAFFPSLASY